jgi:hypothetical protein
MAARSPGPSERAALGGKRAQADYADLLRGRLGGEVQSAGGGPGFADLSAASLLAVAEWLAAAGAPVVEESQNLGRVQFMSDLLGGLV